MEAESTGRPSNTETAFPHPDTHKRLTAILAGTLAGLLGLACFLWRYGLALLNPMHVAWFLNRSDPACHFLAWHYFRAEPWSHPVGRIGSYLAPFGTSIALADAIPLFGVPLKTLSSVLPETFQYLGAFLLLSHIMQGISGFVLMSTVTRDRWAQILGACFFILSPPLLRRTVHAALTAHWLIMLSLALHLAPSPRVNGIPRLWAWNGLLWLAALTSPYLTAMVSGLYVAYLARELWSDRKMGFVAAVVTVLVGVGGGLFLQYEAGYFIGGAGVLPGQEFGGYSMNLNALLNPLGFSAVLPSLPLGGLSPMEGYMYSGLGCLLLAPFALAAASSHRSALPRLARRHSALFIVLGLFAVFSFGNRIRFGDHTLLAYRIPGLLSDLAILFRSNGRFFWPLFYGLLVCILAGTSHLKQKSCACLLLCLALSVQLWDLHRFLGDRATCYREVERGLRLDPARWESALEDLNRVRILPHEALTIRREGDYAQIAYVAKDAGLEFWGGRTGRRDDAAIRELTRSSMEQVAKGIVSSDEIFVVEPRWVVPLMFRSRDQHALVFGQIDGYPVIVPAEHATRCDHFYRVQETNLARLFEEDPGSLFLMTSYGDGESLASLLSQADIACEPVPGGSRYLVAVQNGAVVLRQFQQDRDLAFRLRKGDRIGSVELSVGIEVSIGASGEADGIFQQVAVTGQEVLAVRGGVGVFVLDQAGRITKTVCITSSDGNGYECWIIPAHPGV